MSHTVFVNGETLTDDDWFNDVDRLHYIILGDPANVDDVRTALGITDASGWHHGSGPPPNSLGVDGDYYLDTATGDLYFKAGGVYTVVASVEGPPGPAGADGAQGPQGVPGEQGPPGSDGAPGSPGSQGDPGPGVVPGGTVGQLLAKNSATDFDTVWTDPPTGGGGGGGDVPLGGTTGQVLAKNSNIDLDTEWADPASGPQGPEGPPGPAGSDGEQGPQGDPGADGSPGSEGPPGPQGIQGVAGSDGADGAQGPQGPIGETGPIGPEGPQGPPGTVDTATFVQKSGDTMTGPLLLPDGSLAAPALAWSSGAGIHRDAATNTIRIVHGGVSTVGFTPTQVNVNQHLQMAAGKQLWAADGTLAAPGYSFASAPGSGIRHTGSGALGIGVNGTNVVSIVAGSATVTGSFGVSGALTATSGVYLPTSAAIYGRNVENTAWLTALLAGGDNRIHIGYTGYTETIISSAGVNRLHVHASGVGVTGTMSVSGSLTASGNLYIPNNGSVNFLKADGSAWLNTLWLDANNRYHVGGSPGAVDGLLYAGGAYKVHVHSGGVAFVGNVTGITATMVGLGNVANTRQIFNLRPANSIYIGYTSGVLDVQVDATYFGNNWPITISGNAATATTASNANAVNGISGWNYSNRTKNPVYIWCTDGGTTDQYLTQPGYLSVAYAGTVGSVNGANGGTVHGGIASPYFQPSQGFIHGWTAASAAGNAWNMYWNGTNIYFVMDGQNLGWIQFNSDERLKQDIVPLESDTDAFMKLKPISFRWKDSGLVKPGLHMDGLSAQNIRESFPQATFGDFDTSLNVRSGDPHFPGSVDDRGVVAHVIVQVQKLIERVKQLEARPEAK